ncbi:hypothetical protein [Plantactinospora sp. GCM10030261]|uniref:hypothetical protein n=1 Tax=Plantactinospora sp. GCM10030261 TaxID=3273420 RepID=UPI00362378E7
MSGAPARPRLGAAALAIAAALFVLYPAVRPWTDEFTAAGAAAAMASPAWVASHLFAMIGFLLVPLGLLAVRDLLAATRAEPVAFAAVAVGLLGTGLTLPYYGAEDFGLHAIAAEVGGDGPTDLLGLVEAVRFQPAAAATFLIGLLALGVAAVLTAVAVWRSGVLPRLAGVPFAAGFVLWVPQFYTAAPVRIGHGVLVGAGMAWLATVLWAAVPARWPTPGRRGRLGGEADAGSTSRREDERAGERTTTG